MFLWEPLGATGAEGGRPWVGYGESATEPGAGSKNQGQIYQRGRWPWSVGLGVPMVEKGEGVASKGLARGAAPWGMWVERAMLPSNAWGK